MFRFLLFSSAITCFVAPAETAIFDSTAQQRPARRHGATGPGNREVGSMITQEQNDYLCQTGPGTPMGQLFRSYWIPALLSEELPRPNCPPVRAQLLSERLIAF